MWVEEVLKKFPEFYESYEWFVQKQSHLADKCIQKIPHEEGSNHLFSLLNADEIRRFLEKIWDPEEFRSDYGLRSLSKYHEKHPAEMQGATLGYEPGEALEKFKGGNSNWRGPIWFPLNYFMIDTLSRLSKVFKGQMFIQVKGEEPVNLDAMARSFRERLLAIFREKDGRRPVFGDYEKYQKDPHFQNYLFFNEHFHGDTGRGLGASHQNGWTGLIANLIDELNL